MGPLNPHDYISVSYYTLYELRPANFPRISTTSRFKPQQPVPANRLLPTSGKNIEQNLIMFTNTNCLYSNRNVATLLRLRFLLTLRPHPLPKIIGPIITVKLLKTVGPLLTELKNSYQSSTLLVSFLKIFHPLRSGSLKPPILTYLCGVKAVNMKIQLLSQL
jgi:hypothetical protein